MTEEALKAAFTEIAGRVYEQSGIQIPVDRLRFERYDNPRGTQSWEGRVYYRGPLPIRGNENLPRIKLDLVTDEDVVLKPVRLAVRHDYSDNPVGGISALCYDFEEIYAEKLRALCDRSRARDLYDVVHLFRLDKRRPDPHDLMEVVTRKFAVRGLEFPGEKFVADPAIRESLENTWEGMLQHQLPFLPPFEAFWLELPELFRWLGEEKQPEILRPHALQTREETAPEPVGIAAIPVGPAVTAPAGWISSRDSALPVLLRTHLELIRFGGANHLCVNLRYQGTNRVIEPYSLRRSKPGDILLYAVRRDTREDRSYRVDRIEGASLTAETFQPVYLVELTMPYTPQPIPPTRRDSVQHRSAPRRGSPRSIHRSGPSYVYECMTCGKRFTHKTRDSSLNKHKNKQGGNCFGRRGYLVDTRY